jgi:hypothetical protein
MQGRSPVQLTLFNGSPRGKTGNTKLLMDRFTKGFLKIPGNDIETVYLNRTKQLSEQVELFEKAEHVILAFPLYTDAMPGLVKAFIEELEPFCGRSENPSIGFVVQSGFPEPNHSRFVERYLEKLSRRLGCYYQGTVVRGGVEGIQIQPNWMTRKLYRQFYELGTKYTEDGGFDERILRKLAPREKLSRVKLLFFRFLNRIKKGGFYWDMQLKKNKAFEKKFDKPYQPRD